MLWLKYSSHMVWAWVHWLRLEVTTNSPTTCTSTWIFSFFLSLLVILWSHQIIFPLFSFHQRCVNCLFGEFEHEYVCWIRYILRRRLHGSRTATTREWSGRIRSWSSIFGLSVCCAPTARITVMGVPILFHATADWFGFTVLHNGRLHNGCHWRMAAAVATPKGDFHCYCLRHKLFGWVDVHYTGKLYA